MSQVIANLKALSLNLPELSTSQTLFKPYVISGNQVYISGQLPLGFDEIKRYVGHLGKEFNVEQGQHIAKICMLNVLYHLQNACDGDLDKVKQCVKLTIFVNSEANFTEQPAVANAASDLLLKIFGDKGHHARSAIGVMQLPFGVAVEIEAIFEI